MKGGAFMNFYEDLSEKKPDFFNKIRQSPFGIIRRSSSTLYGIRRAVGVFYFSTVPNH